MPSPGRTLVRRREGFEQRFEVRIDDGGRSVLRIETTADGPVEASVTLREGAWPLPVGEPELVTEPAPQVVRDPRELRLRWPPGTSTVVLALDDGPGPGVARPGPALPGADLVDRLLEASLGFLLPDGRVAYARHPSVYDGEVFGLEEDWLMRGWALGGWGDLAIDAFAATYLTDAHLDDRHPLHDLRRCLLPWQAARLCAAARAAPSDAFDPGAGARLDRCVAWIRASRGPDGLLVPRRFGGDLGFTTQPLYLDLIAGESLRAAGHGAEADAYRAVTLRALDAVAAKAPPDGPRQPLHRGGTDDPGAYLQLMAGGFLAPLGLRALGPDLWARVRADYEDPRRSVRGLPRFDGWGGVPGIDAHYAIGYLLTCLEAGDRATFDAGLAAALDLALDPAVLTAREVSPAAGPRSSAHGHVPGRRLSQSEPCCGVIGMLLQLLHAAAAE